METWNLSTPWELGAWWTIPVRRFIVFSIFFFLFVFHPLVRIICAYTTVIWRKGRMTQGEWATLFLFWFCCSCKERGNAGHQSVRKALTIPEKINDPLLCTYCAFPFPFLAWNKKKETKKTLDGNHLYRVSWWRCLLSWLCLYFVVWFPLI